MKRILLSLIGIILLSALLPGQVKEYEFPIPDTTRYSTPFGSRFMNEDIYWNDKNFRWNNSYYSALVINWSSSLSGLFRTDFVTVGYKFFGFNLLSVYTFNFPMNVSKSKFYSQLFYPLPIGPRVPLLCGKNYDLSAAADLYWPVNLKKEDHDSAYYELHILDEDIKTTYKNTPYIIDLRLDLRVSAFKHAGISAFAGYRWQLSDWYGKSYGKVIYTNDLSGAYFGVSLCYGVFTRDNKGVGEWKEAVNKNASSSYRKFLSDYPGSHYDIEANERLEDRMYLDAVKGNDSLCHEYLVQFPSGKYTSEVHNKIDIIENSVYMKAKTGTPSECHYYFKKYPGGRYVDDVKSLLSQKLDAIDSADFARALAGTEMDCDKYLRDHPGGKYISNIKSAKQLKIEQGYYNYALNGDYESCDVYLKRYPEGRYAAEITRLRKEKFDKAEEEAYKIVASGKYRGCEEYLNNFPGGKHYADADIICSLLRYNNPVMVERSRLNNPKIENVTIVKERPVSRDAFSYIAVVVEQRGDTMIINSLTSEKNVMEFLSAPLGDKALPYSSIGLQGTKIDITLMTNGFNYDDRIWYPTAKRNAFIICNNDKIIGYNVRYVKRKKSK